MLELNLTYVDELISVRQVLHGANPLQVNDAEYLLSLTKARRFRNYSEQLPPVRRARAGILLMAPTYYNLPKGSLEDRGYILFNNDIEADELVVFHATPAKKLEGILTDGLHPGAKFGGILDTISYGETSKDAMVHRHYSDTKTTQDWFVLALKFETRDGLYDDHGTLRSRPLKKQPEIIGVMEIPAGYETQ